MGQAAVFLDRDGVLIEEVGYPTRPEHIRILGGVARALARLAQAGFKQIVVTNQSAIARGLMTEEDLDRFHEALDEQLDLLGVGVDAYYACPHHPDPSEAARQDLAVECECRKPKPGLILQAAEDLEIDLDASWLVGDTWRDIQAGQAAGLRTIKLPADPSHDALRRPEVAPPTVEAADLNKAVDIILGEAEPVVEEPATFTRRACPPWRGGAGEPAGAKPADAVPPPEPPPAPSPEPISAESKEPTIPRAQPEVAEQEPLEDRPPVKTCARCGQVIPPVALDAGTAGSHDGLFLCSECFSRQPREKVQHLPQDTTALLRAVLTELRRVGRARESASLSAVRLFAYVLQAAALFVGVWGLVGSERAVMLPVAIFLQLLVVTLLVIERQP